MSEVLIVDDNPEMLKRLGRIVAQADETLVVTLVSSYADARDAIERRASIGIAIVDVYLSDPPKRECPEGLSLVKLLRKVRPNCHNVLFSSSLETTDDLGDIYEPQDVDDFVSAWYANRDWRSQLRTVIESAALRCGSLVN